MQTELNATVSEREDLSASVFLLRVKPDEAAQPFEPGQFIQVGLPLPTPARDGSGAMRVRMQKRSYSVASAPGDPRGYELCLALVAAGRLTPELYKMRPGARLFLDTHAMGRFTLERISETKDLVLVATGTGIAPYVSMRRALAGTGRWKRMTIVHGVRQVADLCYRAELEQAAREDSTFTYLPIVSRETDRARWSGLTGHVQPVLERMELAPQSAHVFLCGNPAMIDETRKLLEPRGFLPDTPETLGGLRFERYW